MTGERLQPQQTVYRRVVVKIGSNVLTSGTDQIDTVALAAIAEQIAALVAKGVHAPVAAYAEVCRGFIRVNTPGVTTADLSRLQYHHRRRPLHPFET